MEKKIARKAKRFNKVHKRKKIWHRFVSCLAIFVVFWTTYALVLPAITLDSNDYNDGALNTGIQSLEASGLETIYARIVKYDDLQSYVAQPQQFVFFARSGNNYYAFGSSGEAIPLNLTGPLQEGTLVTYTNDDVSSALWIFESYFDTGVSANLDISIQSVKTGDYFFGNPNGFFYNSDDRRPGFYDTEGCVAPGATLDTDIAVGLWTWNTYEDERILQYKNGQFLNTQIVRSQDVWNGSVTEIHDNMLFDDTYAIYCAVVDEVVKDKQNLTAQVIAREDIWDSAAQGNNYVLFTKVGDNYYALNGDGTASQINVKGDLEEGAIIYYGGNDPRNISWEFENRYDQNDVNANIDVSIRNVQTRQYLYPTNNGMFSNSADARPRTICSFHTNI